jgi:hypothetical protein
MDPRHLAFVRDDQYGEGGLAPQPLSEKLRIALMALLVVPFKVLGTICCIVFVFASCKIASLLPPAISGYVSTGAGRLGARLCLLSLGFLQVEWVRHGGKGAQQGAQHPAAAIVSNHVSWMDILVHMSRSFPSFVARDGTQDLPLIGVVRWGRNGAVVQVAPGRPAARRSGQSQRRVRQAAPARRASCRRGRPSPPAACSRIMQCIYVKRENKDAGTPVSWLAGAAQPSRQREPFVAAAQPGPRQPRPGLPPEGPAAPACTSSPCRRAPPAAARARRASRPR